MSEESVSRLVFSGGEVVTESDISALRVFTEDCRGRARCEGGWFACRYAERVGHRDNDVIEILSSLCDDGLLQRRRAGFEITDTGRAVLDDLS